MLKSSHLMVTIMFNLNTFLATNVFKPIVTRIGTLVAGSLVGVGVSNPDAATLGTCAATAALVGSDLLIRKLKVLR